MFKLFKKANSTKNEKIVLLDNLENSSSLEDKIVFAKELLLKTNVLITENVLIQFDDKQWGNETNYFKKFLEYKKIDSKVYRNIDCDVSILCMVMYTLLNPKLKESNIINQYNSVHKFEIRNNDERFKGDTLTSALYLLKLYLGCLWKEIDNNPKMHSIAKYRNFHKLFNCVARTGIPISPYDDWQEYCYKYSDIIWAAIGDEAKSFLKCYNMFGNYLCIPGNSYKIGNMWTSFNMARSNRGKWDTTDTLLYKIYCYYHYNDSSYIKAIFTDKKDELADETIKWLNQFGGWSDFLETNALKSFVDETTLIPISLKTGKKIDLSIGVNYDPIPKNMKEFNIFFNEFSKRIVRRNTDISSRITKRNDTTN